MGKVNSSDISDRESAWLAQYANLFDTIEKTPLTQEQRRACVSDCIATLVLAGAGTGKTSTLTGRVAFLVSHGLARPEHILCLAFGREAAQEIGDRLHKRLGRHLSLRGFSASTFHSLGLHIVRQVEKVQPSLTALCDEPEHLCTFVQTQVQERADRSDEYASALFHYFAMVEPGIVLSCEYAQRAQYEAAIGLRLIRTIRGESVRTPFECLVANALCLMGLAYRYRVHYPHPVFIAKRHPYRCSFYLPQGDVYIDVFDRTQANASRRDVALARKYVHIHQFYGSRHFMLWEAPSYVNGFEPLIGDLLQNLRNCGVCVDTEAKGYLSQGHRKLIDIMAGSIRWKDLLNYLAGLLPLYRQRRLQPEDVSGAFEALEPGQSRRMATVLALLAPVADAYESHLQSRGEIDFDDMIARATRYVRQRRFIVPWRDILIDEFQDMSSARFALISAMIEQQPALRLFCVGDDWQAIYRFAGSDIRYSTQFVERVHRQGRVVSLSCTFRFNQALCDVSGRFLMKNPNQNRKQLRAMSDEAGPIVSVVCQKRGLAIILSRLYRSCCNRSSSDNDRATLSKAPSGSLSVRAKSPAAPMLSVLLLSRFSHLLPDERQMHGYKSRYPALLIMSSTVHTSKGLEADYVFILNMEQGIYGFPSSRAPDCVRDAFLPEPERFENADERRLFYVALTRARKHVWLLVPEEKEKRSVFVQELLHDNKTRVEEVAGFSFRPGRLLRALRGVSPRLNMTIGIITHALGWIPVGRVVKKLTDRHKLAITVKINEIQSDMIGIDVSTEKNNRVP